MTDDTATTSLQGQPTRVQERLTRVQEQIRRVRASERVLAEQVAYLDEVAEDSRTRKLVAATPLADREWRDAQTDRDRHRLALDEARRQVASLLDERDRLLERLYDQTTARRRDTL